MVPGIPHNVTQRGNRRQKTYLIDADYLRYLRLMARACDRFGVDIWAYCLMPNHSHLVAVPESEEALRLAIGEAHREYTAEINKREGWQGHLWQGRFFSCAMNDSYTRAAVRYVELNPVRAGLVARPQDYPWSSARAHLDQRDDLLVKVRPMLEVVGDWASYLGAAANDDQERLRRHVETGRPLGDDPFIEALERKLGRPLRPAIRGRPKGS